MRDRNLGETMAGLHVTLDTDTWLKVEPEGWVRSTGWTLVVLGVCLYPIRMWPFFWATGLGITSLADPLIVLLLALLLFAGAALMFSQPAIAEAEKDAGEVIIESGFMQLQEVSVKFSEVSGITTASHPLMPSFKRVMVATSSGKKLSFGWSSDADEATHVADRLRALVATAASAPAEAAPAEAAPAEAAPSEAPPTTA